MKTQTIPSLLLLSLITTVHWGKAHAQSDTANSALISYSSTTRTQSGVNGNSTSRSRSSLIERKLGERDSAMLWEYTFPSTDITNTDVWKLPARVLVHPDGWVFYTQPILKLSLHQTMEQCKWLI